MTVKSTIPPFEEVYTPKEAAVRLKVSESFLAKKRVSGGGPKFVKMEGRLVRYPDWAINEYVASHMRTSTSDTGSGLSSGEAQTEGANAHLPENSE